MTQLTQATKVAAVPQGVFIGEDTANLVRAEYAEAGTCRAYEEHARQRRRATPFGASEQNWRRRDKFFEYQRTCAIDATRARCMTEVFQATEGQPQAIRIARGVARTLAEIPVFIDDDDLFAGNVTGTPMGSHIYPELMPDYYTSEMVDWDVLRAQPWPVLITPEDLALLTSIAPYWRGKTVGDRWNELRRADDEALNRHCLYFSYNMLAGIGHVIANIPLVLRRGLAGLRQDAMRARRDAQAPARKPDPDRLAFYDSVIISLDGVVRYAQRHADECARLAAAAGDPARRLQLERMAEACRRVPEHPPRDTFEALQSALLVLYALAAESSQISICPGRVDQWLAPFVEHDLATSTPPEAIIELLEAVICKLAHWWTFTGREAAIIDTGNNLCTFTIGGSHADGSDASTVVTEMVLRAYNHMRMAHPPLALRVHEGTPAHVWEAAVLCISTGCGMPSFMNDEVMVPALASAPKTRTTTLTSAASRWGARERRSVQSASGSSTWRSVSSWRSTTAAAPSARISSVRTPAYWRNTSPSTVSAARTNGSLHLPWRTSTTRSRPSNRRTPSCVRCLCSPPSPTTLCARVVTSFTPRPSIAMRGSRASALPRSRTR